MYLFYICTSVTGAPLNNTKNVIFMQKKIRILILHSEAIFDNIFIFHIHQFSYLKRKYRQALSFNFAIFSYNYLYYQLENVEDDCYIYTYKGGTAYLSADLPNSFFRLDSGSDGESLPGNMD